MRTVDIGSYIDRPRSLLIELNEGVAFVDHRGLNGAGLDILLHPAGGAPG